MASQGLTITETAKELNVSVRTIHRYIKKGLIPTNKIGGRHYISPDNIRHIDKLKAEPIDAHPDPRRHIILDRQEWQGMIDRLSQLEAERILLLETEKASKEREEALKQRDQELARIKERTIWIEAELHNINRPWWKKVLGIDKKKPYEM